MPVNKIGNFPQVKQMMTNVAKRTLFVPAFALITTTGLHAQDRFEKQIEPCSTATITENMSVEHIQYNGSPVQQLTASLFDIDKSGTYDKDEADVFNNHDISLKEGKNGNPNELVLTSKTTGNQIKFIYKNNDDLVNYAVEDGGFYHYANTEDFALELDGIAFNCKSIVIDLVNDELTIDGMQKGYINSAFKNNTIKNSIVKEIHLTSEEKETYLTLDKVNAGNDKPTKVSFNPNSKLILDDNDSLIQPD